MTSLKEERKKKKFYKQSKHFHKPEEFLRLGIDFCKQGRFNLAIESFTRAIKLNSNYYDAYFNRGECFFSIKNYESALNDYNKYIELNPTISESYLKRGLCYFELKNYKLSLADFNESIRLNPNNYSSYINRGLCYTKLNINKLALEDYNQSIQLNHNVFESYYNVGLCYLKQDEYEKSLEYFNKAINLNSNDYESYHDRGLCHFRLKNYDFALTDFKKTIALKSDYFETYNDIGNCYYQLKEYNTALENYNKTIKLIPNYAKAYYNCAFYYAKQENYELAIDNLVKAIDFYDSENSKKRCCLFISDIYVTLKKYDDARKYVEQAFNYFNLKYLQEIQEIQDKSIYLQRIDKAEEVDEKNKQLIQQKEAAQKIVEEKNKQLLEKEKELEDMMSMFAHKFRSPLDAIIYNTSHDKDPKLYIEAAQTMRGLLDVFSIISTDDKILKEKIKADNQGNARLITVLSKTLDMILLHLLSVAGTEKIQQHYLRYAKAQGKVAESITPKEWYNDYFELERDLQSEWEQSFSQLLRQSASLEQRLNWIEQHFFKLDIIGFERNDIQFKEYATTESFLTILLNETLVNVFKYYSCETQQAVILEWSERDGNQILSCRNPSIRRERTAMKGSGKGHVFLSALARKIGTQFIKPKLQDDFVLEFSIPNELLLPNVTGEK